MDAICKMLYLELRQSEKEINESLQKDQMKDWLKPLLEDELADIVSTISKMEQGKFGQCEISGELIPEELLRMVPTLKSINEFQNLSSFYRKTINSYS